MPGLPTPPAAPTVANAAAPEVAPVAADAVSEVDAEDDAPDATGNKFGPGRGEAAIPVPNVLGIDLVALGKALYEQSKALIPDVPAFCDAFDEMNKSQFPGNRDGKGAYDTCRIIGLLDKNFAERVRKARESKIAKLESLIRRLAGAADKSKLEALGITNLDELLG